MALEQAKKKVDELMKPPSIQDTIKKLEQAQFEARKAGIESERQAALTGIAAQEQAVKPALQVQRRDIQTEARRSQAALAERLAALGLARGGETPRQFQTLEAQRQRGLGAVGRQETAFAGDIARQRAAAEQQAVTGLAGARAETGAMSIQQQIEEMRRGEEMGFQREQFAFQKSQAQIENEFRQKQSDIENALNTRQITNQEAQTLISNANADRQFELQKAGVTGEFEGEQTQAGIMNQLSIDYQTIINSNLPEKLRAEAQRTSQQLQAGELSIEEARFRLQELQDPNSVTNRSAALDLKIKDLQAQSLPEEIRLNLERLRKTNAELGKIEEKTPLQIAEENLRLAQIEEALSKIGAPETFNTIEDFNEIIQSQFTIKAGIDPITGQQIPAQLDKPGILDYLSTLKAKGVTKEIINALGERWGIAEPEKLLTPEELGAQSGFTGGIDFNLP